MYVITKKFRFEASHRLPNHQGACKNLHGHSYVLEVSIASNDLWEDGEEEGMIMDFGFLKEVVNKVAVDKYDHSYLNDYFRNPTAELMVKKIFDDIQAEFSSRGKILFNVYKVRLYETVNSWAEWAE